VPLEDIADGSGIGVSDDKHGGKDGRGGSGKQAASRDIEQLPGAARAGCGAGQCRITSDI
jgi:hypothetical protein